MKRKRKIQEDKIVGLSKGVLTVTEVLKPATNAKHVEVRCVCSRCGQTSTVRLDRITNPTRYSNNWCDKCRDDFRVQEYKKNLIGKTNGVLTCIDVVLDTSADKHLKYKAICQCSRCGSITETRLERLNSDKYSPKSCTNCYPTLVKETTHKRYFNLSGFSNEQDYRNNQKAVASLCKFKGGARSRNFSWELTDEEALTMFYEPCFYCGEGPSWGIDRISSKEGYIKSNVVPCCGVCNVMKNKFTQEEFLGKVRKIYKNLHLESSTTIPKGSTLQANGSGNGGCPEKDSDIV